MIVLSGGTVVTSLSPPEVTRTDLLVDRGRILEVGPWGSRGEEVRDCSGCLVLPGAVCAHHHLYSSLGRGMPNRLPPPTDFVEILRRVWWRLDRALDQETVWASAILGGAVALLSGTTTIIDHHASPNAVEGSLDSVASALDHLGARSILCYEVTDRDGPEVAAAGVEENRRFLKADWHLCRGMVGAHASFTLSEDALAACVDLARSAEAGLHVHVAEDQADQRDSLARFGRRVVSRLADAGALDERSLLAHCVHLDDEELELVTASRATAVHNPTSNMNNRVGRAPVQRFRRLALGTDGMGGDMLAEGRAAYLRAREEDPAIGLDWPIDRLAESARFAGRIFGEPLLGTIRAGAPADLVVLAYDPPTPLSAANLPGHVGFGLSARHVRDVMVGGEWSVVDRRLARVDTEDLTARCRDAAGRLWRRMDEIDEHPFVPAGDR